MFLAYLSSVIALLCSTLTWAAGLPLLCIIVVVSSLETWKIQYCCLTPNWTMLGSTQIASSELIAEQKPLAVTNGAGLSHQSHAGLYNKLKIWRCDWCIIFKMNVPVLANIQRDRGDRS